MRALLLVLLVSLVPLSASAAPLDEGMGGPRLDVAGTFLLSEDQFVRRGGHGVHLTLRPIRFLGFDFLAAGFPDLGESDYTLLTRDFLSATEVAPSISRVLGMVHFGLHAAPLVGRLRPLPGLAPTEIAWYWVLGGGLTATQDDMELVRSPCREHATQAERAADPDCAAVDEVQPTFVVGSGIRTLVGGVILVALEARFTVYSERTQVGTFPEVRRTLWFGLSLGGSLPLER